MSAAFSGWKAEFLFAFALLLSEIVADGIQVVVETFGILISDSSHFFNDFVFPLGFVGVVVDGVLVVVPEFFEGVGGSWRTGQHFSDGLEGQV